MQSCFPYPCSSLSSPTQRHERKAFGQRCSDKQRWRSKENTKQGRHTLLYAGWSVCRRANHSPTEVVSEPLHLNILASHASAPHHKSCMRSMGWACQESSHHIWATMVSLTVNGRVCSLATTQRVARFSSAWSAQSSWMSAVFSITSYTRGFPPTMSWPPSLWTCSHLRNVKQLKKTLKGTRSPSDRMGEVRWECVEDYLHVILCIDGLLLSSRFHQARISLKKFEEQGTIL